MLQEVQTIRTILETRGFDNFTLTDELFENLCENLISSSELAAIFENKFKFFQLHLLFLVLVY